MSIMGVQTVVTTSRPAQVSELPSDWPANCTMWWGRCRIMASVWDLQQYNEDGEQQDQARTTSQSVVDWAAHACCLLARVTDATT